MNNQSERLANTNLRFSNRRYLTCSSLDPNAETYRRLSLQAFETLNELRCQNKLCDFTLVCDDSTEFPIHRIVLSASSSYFKALFTNGMNETKNPVVYIKDIQSEIMKLIIGKHVIINSDNVERLLPAADRFQMFGLVAKCNEFLEKCLDFDNVLGIRKFSICFYSESLKKASDRKNFMKVVESSSEFLELSFEELNDLILCDELNIKSENDVFDVIVKWIEYRSARKEYLEYLIRSLRFAYIDKSFFIEKIRSHPFIKESNELINLLDICSKYLIDFPNQRVANLTDIRFRPRIPHELLVVVGGWSIGSPTHSIETYDPKADIWQNFEYVDRAPRAYHGCILLGDYIYIIGGFDGTQYFNNCRKFNIVKREWEEMAPMNIKRCYVSVALCNGIIYAMGGFDGYGRHKTAEKYIPEKNQWSFIAEMNEYRSDASATEFNGKIYICGGFNGSDCLDSVEFYDPDTNRWALIARMSTRRSGVGFINYFGSLYALGGYDGFIRLNTCERYDFTYRRWTQEADMITPRSNFGVAVFDDDIYVMGGFNGITTVANVECYNFERKEWKIKEKMNMNRSALAACVFKDIELIRPFSALVVKTKLEDKLNRKFLNNVFGLSQNYISYLRSFN
ncbi:unnamed protein product [Brachionus calyciflorus]|uniref:BTB domain-containing protein n=1 Tax=Brachionus calyciflorus TaxID=104777 RepID=A0A813M538_9BILA|nr:unnamed protein product [Brachionus calyciflorus]